MGSVMAPTVSCAPPKSGSFTSIASPDAMSTLLLSVSVTATCALSVSGLYASAVALSAGATAGVVATAAAATLSTEGELLSV